MLRKELDIKAVRRAMISSFTMANVAVELTNCMFDEKLASLDITLERCLREAFADEKISKERQDRIVVRFCDALLRDEVEH